MSAYRKAIELGLTGTDTQIVNDLQSLTAYNIPAKDAVEWLREGGYWQEMPGGMTGTLQPIYTASTGTARKRLDDVWAWLFAFGADKLVTTRPSQAGRVLFMINQIPSLTGAVKDTFFAIGGGRPWKTLTVQEFDTSRIQALAEDAVAAAEAVLRARRINAAALAQERILITDTPEEQAAKWALCWVEGV
jgi:hypothetical protein